ncbi:MAG TPA: S1 RNA-binding domain-containing protein [Thermoanaerobaculia bacterium]|nr:S1 RNA-binding domain-containing protein [Thermoanaerobaculia bacterium]
MSETTTPTDETPTPEIEQETAATATAPTEAPEAATVAAAETAEPPAGEPAASEPAAEAAPAAEAETPAAEAAPPVAEPAASEPAAEAAPAEEAVEENLEHLAEPLRVAYDTGAAIEGKVIGWNQGGFHVALGATSAFCPRSEMEIGHAHEPGRYLDQAFQFRILRVEDFGRRVVLTRAALLREERRRHADELRHSLQPGAVVTGRVRSLTDFGAFIDLGGVEGLVHVSEISRQRVQKPADVLKVGQEVQVKVLKIGHQGNRISLSIKALEPDPWAGVVEKYQPGATFTGKVLRKADFGLFVELEPNLEGLVHLSQLPLGKEFSDPSLAPGEEVSGWIREVDPGRRRISLALREIATTDPWREVGQKYPEGALVDGKVEKIASFGVFIELEPGLTGLLPVSETGLPRGASLGKAYPPGKQVKLQIAAVDVKRRRISLALEGKTLEGSRADYQAYLRRSREASGQGFGPMAAALRKLRES